MMASFDWVKEYPGAVTVCDTHGIILFMNDRSIQVFGRSLVGENVLACHPEPARGKLEELLRTQAANTYTIEKNGRKKLVHQSPWYEDGAFKGLVELSFEIPDNMPHFVRTPKPEAK